MPEYTRHIWWFPYYLTGVEGAGSGEPSPGIYQHFGSGAIVLNLEKVPHGIEWRIMIEVRQMELFSKRLGQ